MPAQKKFPLTQYLWGVVLGFVFGGLVTFYLVLPRSYGFPLFLLIIGVLAAAIGAWVLLGRSGQGAAGHYLAFAVIFLVCGLIGYGATSYAYLNRPLASPPAKPKPGASPTRQAVIFVDYGEPQVYDQQEFIQMFQSLDRSGLPTPPQLARPFLFYQVKKQYEAIARSPHRQSVEEMVARVKAELPPDVLVYTSFLNDQPHFRETVVRAMGDGAKNIVVVPMFLAESASTDQIKKDLLRLNLPKFDRKSIVTKPLWDARALSTMYVERALAGAGTTPLNKTAVVLIGHGQPESWDQAYPQTITQEKEFHDRLKKELIRAGFPEKNITQAWLEYRKPDITETVKKILPQKPQKILYIVPFMPADGLHTLYDAPQKLEKAKVPPNTEVVRIGGWNLHPAAIAVLAERANEGLQSLTAQ